MEVSKNGYKKFSTHEMKLQISYNIFTKIQKASNIWATEKRNRPNIKKAM